MKDKIEYVNGVDKKLIIDIEEPQREKCDEFKVGDKVKLKYNMWGFREGTVMEVYRKYKPLLHLRNLNYLEESLNDGRYPILKTTPKRVEKIKN